MTRLGLVVGLLLAPVALGQPTTVTVPIVARTPAANPVTGTGPLTEAVVLPPLSAQLDQTLAFGAGGGAPAVFRVADATPTTVSNLPATIDAIATAPGVMVNGVASTVLAISTGGAITLGTLEANAFVARNAPGIPIPATTLVAMTATPDAGAALFVSDGTNITRWDIDGSGTNLVATQGFTISANPTAGGFTDSPRVLVVDGLGGQAQRGLGYVGGGTLGDIYVFDAQLDAGSPSAFDVAQVSLGRLAPPITGLALMQGLQSDYLLAANTQGLTVYDLTLPSLESLAGAFVLRGADSAGTLTVPLGVGATNLSASTLTPGGAIVVGNLGIAPWPCSAGRTSPTRARAPTVVPWWWWTPPTTRARA